MASKWDFIIGCGKPQDIVAKELAYAYILGLETGHKMSDAEYVNLLNNQETFIATMIRNYLSELNCQKADYYGVIA